jgi:hypothetical protein
MHFLLASNSNIFNAGGLTAVRKRNYNTFIFMVKIHLFSGFENSRLKIGRDTPLGHLYSDFSPEELLEAAHQVGVKRQCIQNSRGFYHFDLWGKPLLKARLFYPRVSNRELYRDLQAVRNHNSPLETNVAVRDDLLLFPKPETP